VPLSRGVAVSPRYSWRGRARRRGGRRLQQNRYRQRGPLKPCGCRATSSAASGDDGAPRDGNASTSLEGVPERGIVGDQLLAGTEGQQPSASLEAEANGVLAVDSGLASIGVETLPAEGPETASTALVTTAGRTTLIKEGLAQMPEGQLVGAGIALAIICAVREARLLAQQAQLRALGTGTGAQDAPALQDHPLPSVALLKKLEAQERGLGSDGQLRARALREQAERERQRSVERQLREAQAEERKEQRKKQEAELAELRAKAEAARKLKEEEDRRRAEEERVRAEKEAAEIRARREKERVRAEAAVKAKRAASAARKQKRAQEEEARRRRSATEMELEGKLIVAKRGASSKLIDVRVAMKSRYVVGSFESQAESAEGKLVQDSLFLGSDSKSVDEVEALNLQEATRGGALALVGRVAAVAVEDHASAANMQALLGKGQLKYMTDGEMVHRLRLLSIRAEISGCLCLQKLSEGSQVDAQIAEKGGSHGAKGKHEAELVVRVARPIDETSGRYTEAVQVAARHLLDRLRVALLTEQRGLEATNQQSRVEEAKEGWALIEAAAEIEAKMVRLEFEQQAQDERGIDGSVDKDGSHGGKPAEAGSTMEVRGLDTSDVESDAGIDLQLDTMLIGSSERSQVSTLSTWNRLLEGDITAVNCWQLASSSVWRTVARVADVFLELTRESTGGEGFAIRGFTQLVLYESPLLVSLPVRSDDEEYDEVVAARQESCIFSQPLSYSFGHLWQRRPDLIAEICTRHYGEQNLLSVALVELVKEQRRRQRDLEEELLIDELDASALRRKERARQRENEDELIPERVWAMRNTAFAMAATGERDHALNILRKGVALKQRWHSGDSLHPGLLIDLVTLEEFLRTQMQQDAAAQLVAHHIAEIVIRLSAAKEEKLMDEDAAVLLRRLILDFSDRLSDWPIERAMQEATRIESKLDDEQLQRVKRNSLEPGLIEELSDQYNPELEAYRV